MKTKIQIERELYAQREIIAKAHTEISNARKWVDKLNEQLAALPAVQVTTESIAAPIMNLYGEPYDAICADAIKALTVSGGEPMMKEYYGMKIYSGFGPQRHDTVYGMGPKHGSIYGSVGFTKAFRAEKRALTDAEAQACIDYVTAWRDSAKAAA